MCSHAHAAGDRPHLVGRLLHPAVPPGVRPVASPADPDVIVNACESAPYRLSHGVRRHDRFWIKGQPYSVAHMLADDPWADQFAGGTIYQAFLSPLSYHRWHSPVDGWVLKAYVHDRTYYSETPAEGYDPSGPNDSQATSPRSPPGRWCPSRPTIRPSGLCASFRPAWPRFHLRDHRVSGTAREKGRLARHVPLRRLDALPDVPPRLRFPRADARADLQQHPGQRPDRDRGPDQ